MKQRWEYRIVEGGKGMSGASIRDASTDILNRLGLDGWECYAVNGNTLPTIFYLKRPR
ncbi:DUF4177 domain-containing protein [uncultured Algimonas sp.]|uniref:DUF4177 domain-containing protein n=1 Tax=uncultured Algimonas sp. TaxID=1547920 RepID=UPI00260390A7|nr:DUF4177 domain-containing protein [uncultured Algimonas sp.]